MENGDDDDGDPLALWSAFPENNVLHAAPSSSACSLQNSLIQQSTLNPIPCVVVADEEPLVMHWTRHKIVSNAISCNHFVTICWNDSEVVVHRSTQQRDFKNTFCANSTAKWLTRVDVLGRGMRPASQSASTFRRANRTNADRMSGPIKCRNIYCEQFFMSSGCLRVEYGNEQKLLQVLKVFESRQAQVV